MNEDLELLKRIKTLESQVLAYKGKQPVGSDSVRTFTTQTNNIWDVTQTVVEDFPGSGSGQVRASVKFKARNQLAPFGRLRVFITINGENYNFGTPSASFNTTTPYVFFGAGWQGATLAEVSDPTTLVFNVVGSAAPGAVIRYKFVVDATDSGRLYYDVY